jgi:hypothetical protein
VTKRATPGMDAGERPADRVPAALPCNRCFPRTFLRRSCRPAVRCVPAGLLTRGFWVRAQAPHLRKQHLLIFFAERERRPRKQRHRARLLDARLQKVTVQPSHRILPSRGGESRACGAAPPHADPPVLGVVLGLAAPPPVAQTALEEGTLPGIMRGGGWVSGPDLMGWAGSGLNSVGPVAAAVGL